MYMTQNLKFCSEYVHVLLVSKYKVKHFSIIY